MNILITGVNRGIGPGFVRHYLLQGPRYGPVIATIRGRLPVWMLPTCITLSGMSAQIQPRLATCPIGLIC